MDLNGSDGENAALTKSVLVYVLQTVLKLLHPFVPFITEEIYQALPHSAPSIMISDWPKKNATWDDAEALEAFSDLTQIITAIRNERAKAGKAPSAPIDLTIVAKDQGTLFKLKEAENYLVKFTNPKQLTLTLKEVSLEQMVVVVLPMATIVIPSSDLIDMAAAKEKLLQTKKEIGKRIETQSKSFAKSAVFSQSATKQDRCGTQKTKRIRTAVSRCLRCAVEIGVMK